MKTTTESSTFIPKMKTIVYKGKSKEIISCNPDKKLCEFFIVSKMRYCKFEKVFNSEFCIYHIPDINAEKYIDCPIDPSHRVLVHNLEKHLKICNKLKDKQKLVLNEWYNGGINKIKKNEEIIKNWILENEANDFKKLYDIRWEDISDDEYSCILDKIFKCYEILRNDYKKYSIQENLQEILDEKFTSDHNTDNYKVTLSGIEINIDKDLLNKTTGLPKSEKHGKQNYAIGNIINQFNFLIKTKSGTEKEVNHNQSNVFIEFGAGKGGLSCHINTLTMDNSYHILLERDGIRNKKDKHSDKLIRFRTDILDFDINYIDKYFEEKEHLEISKTPINIVGIAKHICGCAFDISLSCLMKYKYEDRIKGIAIATCCHQICKIEFLNNLGFYMNYCNLSIQEIVLLFKATSWIFGPKDTDSKILKLNNDIFDIKGKSKSYFGLISKYIVDFARVFYLIDKKYKVFYLKYCDNEVTLENNFILAIK